MRGDSGTLQNFCSVYNLDSGQDIILYFQEDSELNLLLRGLCTLTAFSILPSNHKNLRLQDLLKYFMTSEIFSVDVNTFFNLSKLHGILLHNISGSGAIDSAS